MTLSHLKTHIRWADSEMSICRSCVSPALLTFFGALAAWGWMLYCCLNAKVAPMNTYQEKVALTLMLIQGDLVKNFVRTQRPGDVLDQSIEEPDTWFNFLRAFDARFPDTQRNSCARTEIKNLRLKDYNVDEYVQYFIVLAREAQYDL